LIHVTAIPLTNEQTLQIQNWLKEPTAELYRRVLASNIADLQAKVGQNFIEAKGEKNRQDQDAIEQAGEALVYVHALAVFDDFLAGKGNLIDATTISLEPPPKIAELNT
jgi:hypothetical protein